jgi:hypothetical protein
VALLHSSFGLIRELRSTSVIDPKSKSSYSCQISPSLSLQHFPIWPYSKQSASGGWNISDTCDGLVGLCINAHSLVDPTRSLPVCLACPAPFYMTFRACLLTFFGISFGFCPSCRRRVKYMSLWIQVGTIDEVSHWALQQVWMLRIMRPRCTTSSSPSTQSPREAPLCKAEGRSG